MQVNLRFATVPDRNHPDWMELAPVPRVENGLHARETVQSKLKPSAQQRLMACMEI
jgi:hypothetical protein